MRSWFGPTSLTTPASTASGRSVSLRSTSTGLPSAGASSCTPPESLMMKYACFMAATKLSYSSGAHRCMLGRSASAARATSRTFGLGCTG